jgi:hypothetical protein
MKNPQTAPPAHEEGLCLIRNDWFFRLQQKLGLVPDGGLGVARRALFWSMLSWLPIVFWAAATGHVTPTGEESVLQHYGVHVRCLVAIPLFLLAEGMVNAATTQLLPYFVDSGLVRDEEIARFRKILKEMSKLRDSAFPWIAIAGIIVARATLPLAASEIHELAWAGGTEASSTLDLGFGGWWFLYVTRSVFLILALAWLWRLVLLGLLLARIARLDLSIVPSHPDGLGGLGFIEQLPKAFSLVVLAFSAVAAAKWGHGLVFHQESVLSLKPLMIGFSITVLAIFLAPYLSLFLPLMKAKKQALLDYGKLVGNHGRLVRRRWILNEPVEYAELLSAPEIGPVADTAAIYEAVTQMRSLPIGKKAFIALAIPLSTPILILLSIQVPIKDILLTLLKTLA